MVESIQTMCIKKCDFVSDKQLCGLKRIGSQICGHKNDLKHYAVHLGPGLGALGKCDKLYKQYHQEAQMLGARAGTMESVLKQEKGQNTLHTVW